MFKSFWNQRPHLHLQMENRKEISRQSRQSSKSNRLVELKLIIKLKPYYCLNHHNLFMWLFPKNSPRGKSLLEGYNKVQTELKFDHDDYKKLIQNEFDMLSKDTPSR